jgi:ABC-type branched-subunit amino acid transport system substrate-binding protein
MFRPWTASFFSSALWEWPRRPPRISSTGHVTDTEIKLGQTAAYSGPASAFGTISKTQASYVRMVNEHSGVNGRKINLISLDDGYSPPKAVEFTRRLIEEDRVLAIFDSLGMASNAAIQGYLNERHVPHFPVSGASRFNDPTRFPWSMGVIASYETEGKIYAKYILQNIKDAKIGVLYQKMTLGRITTKGFKMVLAIRRRAEL